MTSAIFQQLSSQQPDSEEDSQMKLTGLKKAPEKSKPNKTHT